MPARERGAARQRARIALFDADTLSGKGVREQLVARRFPIGTVRLFTSSDDPEHNLAEFNGEAMLLSRPDIDALGPLDLAFLCGGPAERALYADWPRRKGFVAIDLTGAAGDGGVPVVNAGVNPQAIDPHPGIIGTPHPIALLLSSLLAPVARHCGLSDVSAVVFQPASEGGEQGIEELHQQTIGLLNFHDLPRRVFGRQLAFNLVPSFLYERKAVPGGGRPEPLAREVLAVTGGDYRLSLEVILVPVFHCHAVLARLSLPPGRGREDLLAAFRAVEGISAGIEAARATPAERAGKPGMVLAGIHSAGRDATFWIWAVNDNLKSGAAQNAVRIAELLLDRGLARGDA